MKHPSILFGLMSLAFFSAPTVVTGYEQGYEILFGMSALCAVVMIVSVVRERLEA